jgi:hypothetical protein
MGEIKQACRVLVGKSEQKGPLGRPGGVKREVLKTDVAAVRCEVADWIHLAQDNDPVFVNTVINLGFR